MVKNLINRVIIKLYGQRFGNTQKNVIEEPLTLQNSKIVEFRA